MTRKDFEVIAQIVANTSVDNDSKDTITLLLSKTNPRFDEVRFWKAVEKYNNI